MQVSPETIYRSLFVPRKDTHTVTRAIARRTQRLPRGLVKSLTWDRGASASG